MTPCVERDQSHVAAISHHDDENDARRFAKKVEKAVRSAKGQRPRSQLGVESRGREGEDREERRKSLS